jgi:hypothetical protein
VDRLHRGGSWRSLAMTPYLLGNVTLFPLEVATVAVK